MKKIHKVTVLIIAISMIAGLFSGCTATSEGKALYEAMVKTNGIKSGQYEMVMSLKLDSAGLDEQTAAGFTQVQAVLKDAKMSMNMKQETNEALNATKAEVAANMAMGGISMDMDVWVDMDYSGSENRFKEVIKAPPMVFASVPGMENKEYLVMDIEKMMKPSETDSSYGKVDMSGLIEMGKELQKNSDEFMADYLAKFDPGFKLVTDAGKKEITTPEGKVNAQLYKISLDDKSAKKLVRYTVNNLADSKEIMDFMKEYLKLMQQVTVSMTAPAGQTADTNKLMADFETQKPLMLAKFNEYMDKLENVKLLGDKGIVIEYAVDEKGYIVNKSFSMDLIFDLPALAGIAGKESKVQGTISAEIGFDTLTYNIGKVMDIVIPELTQENSMDYFEYLHMINQAAMSAHTITAVPSSSSVTVDGKPMVFDAYTINGSNYIKLRDFAAALGSTAKKFDVSWDADKNSINLLSGKDYIVVGGEMTPGDGTEKNAVPNTSAIYKDGEQVYLEAYKIGNNNYFKLRDMAETFDVGITWDAATNTISIDTASGYTAE